MLSSTVGYSKYCFLTLSLLFPVIAAFSETAFAQAPTFAGNAQHTSQYPAPAQNINALKWTTSIDFNNIGAFTHYGAPLVSAANTVFVPVKIAGDNFRVDVFDAGTAALKYSAATDYILPAHNWIPTYNPCVVSGANGTRMYFAGAGGTIWHIDTADSNTPGAPVREVFYTSLANYNANAAAFNSTVFVNTPIIADSTGNIFFGFRVQGMAPAPLNTSQSGYARIDPNGNGTFVLVGVATSDPFIDRDSHNAAPALSNDETTLYVVAKSSTITNYSYLIGLDPTTLQPKFSVFLRDPRSSNGAGIPDDGTSSPMVGPDGDVFFGAFGNPNNGSRGFLLHYNHDLSITKTPGGFGWDYTAGVVPANMIPSYTGPSSYLLFCKYNNYAFGDGNGINRVAILDPNDTQIDPHPSAPGLVEMREVLTIIGPTPDSNGFPNAVREFCINAPAVNPATGSVFFDNEDGRIYRWNLAANSLDQAFSLNAGIGQPYVPTVIGPDGTVYTLNGGNFFALGAKTGIDITLKSSSPDLRKTVLALPVTFTATVSVSSFPPTGTVTFTDLTYNGTTPVTTTLASNVPLNASGQANITTSTLAAGGNNPGSHFVTATYSGDANHPSTAVTMMQKVHANDSSTSLTASPSPATQGQPIALMATVTSVPTGLGTPTGMVTFRDGLTVIGQVALDGTGVASINRSNLSAGSHNFTASYASDTEFAASEGNTALVIQNGTVLQFSQPNFTVNEGTGSANITVTRTGDSSGIAKVDYMTMDTDTFTVGCSDTVNNLGSAFGRCDYLTSIDTLTFAAGETSKTFAVPIINDALAEGNETFSIVLKNVDGATLATATTTVTINDDEIVNGPNPIFTTSFFVRQHYLDFLSREPEADEPWSAILNGCPNVNNDPTCDRITVSSAFFGSPEFQLKGYFVYRFYQLAFNRLPTYQEIVLDMRSVTGETPNDVFQRKASFTNSFVKRPEFTSRYDSLTNSEYVSELMAQYGLSQVTTPDPANPDGPDKVTLTTAALTNQLIAGTLTRAQVLRAIAESDQVFNAEFNRAFVAMQYYGYLRRAPEALGFNDWLNYLNTHPGDSRTMVNGFVNSVEYRLRFGPSQ